MTTLRTLVAAAGLMVAAAGTAAAQDFTQMDITSMYNGWAANQNYQMNNGLEQIIQQNMNNPQVVALYNQMVANGQFQGDLRTFAYNYAATGAFQNTRGYYDTSNQIVAQEKQAWAGYQGAVQNYRDAYGNYTQGYSGNIQEAGRGLTGQSTYTGAPSAQSLPHTWQANNYYQYQGNNYFVDQSGTYWMADPNGSGYWYQLQR